MRSVTDFIDYQLIDCGAGEKLERWGDVTLLRPDPTCIWPPNQAWPKVDGHYFRSSKGGGEWKFYRPIKDHWNIHYQDLTFKVSPTNFKHTGLFPEQAVNWNWMSTIIKKSNRPIKVLNLFGYTGAATLACAKAGAIEVVHVDAAKGMVEWCKENAKLSGLHNHKIRYIVDDVVKFVQREARRGHTYDGIIMDPPSYGRGPGGEMWKIEEQLVPLINDCLKILSPNPLFFLISSYTTTFSAQVIENIMNKTIMEHLHKGVIDVQEIGLPVNHSKIILPCGVSGRWANDQDSL